MTGGVAPRSPARRGFLRGTAGAVLYAGLAGGADAVAESAYRDPMAGFLLGPGPAGRCDDRRVAVPILWRDPTEGRWMMWYMCRNRAYPHDVAQSLSVGWIAAATSRDGIAWQRIDGPLEGGAVLGRGAKGDFDEMYVGATDVTRVGDLFYLWYFGGAADDAGLTYKGRPVRGYRMRVGVAVSRDGIRWQKQRGRGPGGSIIDYGSSNWASWPNAVHTGTEFALFYTTVKGDDPTYFRTHLALSQNAIDWRDQGEIIWLDGAKPWDRYGAMTRDVIPDPTGQAKWLMFYTAMDGRAGLEMERSIAAARSDDLKHWRHAGEWPLMGPASSRAWDDKIASAPQLVANGDILHIYYSGSSDNDKLPAGIGLATAPLRDLGSLARYGA